MTLTKLDALLRECQGCLCVAANELRGSNEEMADECERVASEIEPWIHVDDEELAEHEHNFQEAVDFEIASREKDAAAQLLQPSLDHQGLTAEESDLMTF